MGEFKTCPRKYYYAIILGYQSKRESVHLTFGILIHGGVERYHHARAKGQDHDEALHTALQWVATQTWNKELKRPWISDSPNKNRATLIRTLIWYLDEKAQNDTLETVILANGKPATELSFRFDLGEISSITGEPFIVCGHFDRIAKLGLHAYIVDIKTTEHTINAGWFSKFTPDNQFSTYTVAGKIAYQQPIAGLIVDGAQVAVTFSRFERQLVGRDEAQLGEWIEDLGYWIAQAEGCASRMEDHSQAPERAWPQNDKACGMYGGCSFRDICSKSPASRQQWLDSQFKRRVWDPLISRGDI